jgi:hypothetical protein
VYFVENIIKEIITGKVKNKLNKYLFSGLKGEIGSVICIQHGKILSVSKLFCATAQDYLEKIN